MFTTNLKDHNTAVATWRKTEQDIRARQAAAVTPATKQGTKAPVPVAQPVEPQPQQTSPATDLATSAPTPPLKEAAPAAAASAASASADASAVPLPVRKPKRP